jgi:filamentous hemagglutinin family protein
MEDCLMANRGESTKVRLLGLTGRKRADLLISTALTATSLFVLAFPAAAQVAPNARPAGGVVAAGSATIATSPNTTTIDQSSQRAAINWQSFNVGGSQNVTFAQPSSSAVALNRVIGPDPSQIAGKINANGQIVLVNQAGVTFYKGAQVNAQSLIVSSANVSNADFMAGRMAFNQPGSANAAVVNEGTITVKQAGLAALAAPNVANSGVINARLGHVVLAGAKTETLDLYGDGLLALDVSNQVTQVPAGPGGKKVMALVTNSGVINADGGTVQLTARAADGVLQKLVQAGGTITANSVGDRTGTVTVAGIGGSVTVTGLVSASGTAANTMGGQVEVNATGTVTLASTARVNASGTAGGGTVSIGTTLRRAIGGPGTAAGMTAAGVVVRKGASIDASATRTGNGGRVTVLSGGTTQMNGTIAGTGGSLSGDGGFVEVSGANLGLTGLVNVSAPHGTIGTILLDPSNLDIIGSTGTTGSSVDNKFVTNGGTSTLGFGVPDPSQPPSTVDTATLTSLGANGAVVIQATGFIDVQAPVTVANGLTMQAGGNLTIESAASVVAGGSLALQAGVTIATGALTINAAVSSAHGNVLLTAGTGGIALNANVAGATVDLNATGGGVTQAGGAGITATTLQSSNGVTGNVSLLGSNAVGNVAGFAVSQGNFQLADTTQLVVTGNLSALGGNVYLQTSSPAGLGVNITGTVTTGGGGTTSFKTDSLILFGTSSVGGSIVTGAFELAPFSAGQTVTLGNAEGDLILPSLAGITSSAVRIGAVTPPGGSAPVTSAAAITVGETFDVLGRNLELDATGTVDGTGGPLINVATLSGTGGAAWTLNQGNSIANIGTIDASSFTLTDSIGLTVAGTLNGGTLAAITDTGLLSINGAVSATSVVLSASSIAIPGLVTDGGAGTVDLIANVGTISETGTLIAGLLIGTAVGTADLSGAGPSVNQVSQLSSPPIFGTNIVGRNFTASSVTLRDGLGLTVGGSVTATGATGQVFLESTAPAGITVAATGSVNANTSGGKASLLTDSLVNNGTVIGSIIELAPATSGGTVTVGTSGGGLSIVSLTGLGTTNLSIGAVSLPGGGTLTTAGSISFAGPLDFSALGTLSLQASSATAPGASGAITQSVPLTGVSALSALANSIDLTNPGNSITRLNQMTATTGDVSVVSGTPLTVAGVSAPAGNAFFESTAAGGVTLAAGGSVNVAGRAGIQADALTQDGTLIVAGTFELAPFTAGNTVTLGLASGGLDLVSLSGIKAGTVRVGAVTEPGGTAPSITAGAVTIAGTFDATAATTLELDSAALNGASGAITQSAPLINVATLAATGASVVLTNIGNSIGASSGIAATAGNLELVDSGNLALNGAYTGSDLFFEIATKGDSLTIGATSAATLTSGAGARISLVADTLVANIAGSIGNAGGTVELAPFSPIPVSVAGSGGGLTIGAALLSDVAVGGGTLMVGGFTNLPLGASTPTVTASAITLAGAVNLTANAGTLRLIANGPVTEPGGPLTVGAVTGSSTGDFSLNNTGNQIQASTGITATGGNVILVDDPTLVLTGLYSGTNLFFQVTQPGGSLALGTGATPATLVAATDGRISLVADQMTAIATSSITAPIGTLEVAPFSALNESVAGTSNSGQLLVPATLLSDINTGANALDTVLIGAYTNLGSNAAVLTVSASSVTLDGPLNLTTQTTNLQLMANGPVTEPGGPLTVTNVFGSSIGLFSLANAANNIAGDPGITASNGGVVLVDGTSLALTGTQSGNNLFFEVATKGGTLFAGTSDQPVALTAAAGGRITLVADQMTENGSSTVTVPSGTVELAPFSAINTSLLGSSGAGQLRIDPALLSIITPGISALVVGGFTNVPAGATGSTPSASSITVDGMVTLAPLATTLDLEASGAVTQSAPIVNVGTLLGTTGSTTLTNANNSVGTLGNYVASNGFALTDATNLLISGQLTAGPSASFTISGALTETGGITAGVLSGSTTGSASLTGANVIAQINGFGANGGFTLNDTGNLLINGSLSATRIVVSDPSSQISLGDGATIVTGGSVRPSGPLPLSLLPQNGAPGALLQAASFVQLGSSTITGLGGGPSTLQISVTGNMQFDPPLGLAATGTWLVLNLTNGIAAGNVFVNALDVSFGFPGGSNLFGTINGIGGQIAARFGNIQPGVNPAYLFNGCEIAAVTCGAISLPSQSQPATQTIPPTVETTIFVPIDALLALVTPALVLDPDDNDNLLQLPVVSKEDY